MRSIIVKQPKTDHEIILPPLQRKSLKPREARQGFSPDALVGISASLRFVKHYQEDHEIILLFREAGPGSFFGLQTTEDHATFGILTKHPICQKKYFDLKII